MTPEEWAEKITFEIDWPDINTKDVEFIKQVIAAAVEEAKAKQASVTWQPIETAPKDGTWILLRGKNSVGCPMIPVVVAWSFGHGLSEPPCWRDSASLRDMMSLAASPDGAEWMPLPPA